MDKMGSIGGHTDADAERHEFKRTESRDFEGLNKI